MAQPYVGEIRIFAGTYAPVGWLFCDGQHLPISENETLFQLIGTTYGGDGESTFALPNLQSRVPMHFKPDLTPGEAAGVESVTLTTQQIPVHTHAFVAAASSGDTTSAAGNLPANSFNVTPYINQGQDGNMSPAAIAPAGGSQPHDNRQPLLALHFIISLFGIFPSPT